MKCLTLVVAAFIIGCSPPLRWLNIDGSYAAIAGLVRTGVPNPKQHSAPMPPMGGATMSAVQVCAVAAYVYSLGHR
jgi:mono/diheme cytochrome c family protein